MDGNGSVDVNIVFTMALNEPHSQISNVTTINVFNSK